MRRAVVLALACACRSGGGDDGGGSGQIAEGGDLGFGGTVVGGVVARGEIEPDVFVPGGLHATAFDLANGIDGGTNLDGIDLGAPTSQVFGFGLEQELAGGPPGLTVADTGAYTLLFDGEVFLPAGTTDLELEADNGVALFELGPGPDRITASGGVVLGTATVATDGWYKIRGGYSPTGPGAPLLLLSSPELGLLQLRARTTDVQGLHETVAQRSELEDVRGAAFFDGASLTGIDVGTGSYALTDRYSLRFEGQLLVDEAGTHHLAATVADGDRYRIFVDGAEVTTTWLAELPQAKDATLTAGWHAIIVEYGHDTGAGALTVTLDGAPVPVASLRPTTPSAFSTGMGDASSARVVDGVDVALTVSDDARGVASIALADGGAARVLHTDAPPNETEDAAAPYDFYPDDGTFTGLQEGFELQVTNLPADATATATLVVRGHGGPDAPFSDRMIYTSGLLPATAGTVLATLEADVAGADSVAGSAVMFGVRTGSLETIEGMPFLPVEPGPLPGIVAGDVVQYQIAIATDGWVFPTVSRVAFDVQ